MGNIRQLNIKNSARQLLENYPDRFRPKDFEHNKQVVNQLISSEGVVTRNRIAGYITRILSPHTRATSYGFENE